MRVGAPHPALVLSLLGGCLLAQQLLAQQSPAPADSQQVEQQQSGDPSPETPDQSHAQLPLTPGPAGSPAEQRALEIRQFDPLAVDKDSANQEKANAAKDNRGTNQRNPAPGSLAASERNR